MIVRTSVAVALAVALLAVSLPVAERARVDHSTATIDGELERVERSAVALEAENDVVSDNGPPARTRVTLRLPVRSWADSGVGTVRFPETTAGSDGPDVIWAAAGGDRRNTTFPEVRLTGPPGGLVVDDGGRQRLVLALERAAGGRTVVVRRAEAVRSAGA